MSMIRCIVPKCGKLFNNVNDYVDHTTGNIAQLCLALDLLLLKRLPAPFKKKA